MINVNPNLLHECQVAFKLLFSSLGKCGSGFCGGDSRRVTQDALSFTCNPLMVDCRYFGIPISGRHTHTLTLTLAIFYTSISNSLHQCPSPQRSLAPGSLSQLTHLFPLPPPSPPPLQLATLKPHYKTPLLFGSWFPSFFLSLSQKLQFTYMLLAFFLPSPT